MSTWGHFYDRKNGKWRVLVPLRLPTREGATREGRRLRDPTKETTR